jgi:hypothetical protein
MSLGISLSNYRNRRADYYWAAVRTTRPSSSSLTLIWHDKREFNRTLLAHSSMESSTSEAGGSLTNQLSSTYTWQVPHEQAPPQIASIPGTLFCAAPSITDKPALTSTLVTFSRWSIYVIFTISDIPLRIKFYLHFQCSYGSYPRFRLLTCSLHFSSRQPLPIFRTQNIEATRKTINPIPTVAQTQPGAGSGSCFCDSLSIVTPPHLF